MHTQSRGCTRKARAWSWIIQTLALLWILALQGMGPAAWAQDSVCAEVKIVIEQKLSLERQAFDAHMRITNGLADTSLGHVRIELTFEDRDNQPVAASADPGASAAAFFFRTDTTSGIDALDGTGTIAAKSTADIHWLIIPAAGTGGSQPGGQLYYVGAKVTYTLNGQESTVEVPADYIVVRPQPLLQLDYFLPREVYGDDAFTDAVEPPVPYTLGVRIKNTGMGASYNTRIESAQPRIVENQQGLLVDFEILGGYVNDEPAGKSLILHFGDIGAGGSSVGRWRMITSLSGRFIEFNASYTHADALGGALTSLLQGVATHTLVQDVLVDYAGRDTVRDFLARDGDVLRVYESDGVDTPVADQSAGASYQASGAQIRFTPASGMVYARLSDPHQGTRVPSHAVRSDGKILPAQNVWLSKERSDNGTSWRHYINLFDVDSTGVYNLSWTQGGSKASLSGAVYQDTNQNGLRDSAEPGIAVVAVVLRGQDQDGLNISTTAYTDAQGDYRFSELLPGTYELQVNARQGMEDGVALVGSAGGNASPGKTTDIVLSAGLQASGYLFAKQTGTQVQDHPQKADLAIAMSAAPSQLRAGQDTTITLVATNHGPDAAQAVTVSAPLPAQLHLQSSSTTSGTYSGEQWNIGALDAGQSATLGITAQADDPFAQEATMAAHIGSSPATTDAVSGNNSATIVLRPEDDDQAAAIRAEQGWGSALRMLVLAACSDGASSQDAACAQNAAGAAQHWLQTHGFEARATTTLADFRAALRQGRHNGIWLHAGAASIAGSTLLEEVRAALRRGDILVLDGPPDVALHALDGAWGGSHGAQTLGEGQQITIDGQDMALPDKAWALQLNDAQTQLRYSGGETAAASATYGQGQALVFGFDVLAALQRAQDEAVLGAYLQQHLHSMVAPPSDPALAGSWRVVHTTLHNEDGQASATARLRTTLPAGMQYVQSQPTPSSIALPTLDWNLDVAAGGTSQISVLGRLPDTSGAIQVQTTLTQRHDGEDIEEPFSLNASVVDANTLLPAVRQALQDMGAADAQALLEQAARAMTDGDDAQAAIEALVALEQSLRGASPQTADLAQTRLSVARLIALSQMQWQDTAAAPQPAQIIAYAGSGQSAQVRTLYAHVLQAQVLDAGGAPLAGVDVAFTLPVAGASAQFTGGGTQLTATTNASGIASSPALTANATAGAWQASAQVQALQASFAMQNTEAPVVPPTYHLQVLSGDDQQSAVNTAFAQALQVRLTDEHGQAVAGKSIRFTLPAMGPSASFAGAGSTQADVTTDAQGLAASPALTANASIGAWQALVSAQDAPPLAFNLRNTATGGGTGNGTTFTGTTATGSGSMTASVSGGGDHCQFNPSATRLSAGTGVLPLLQDFLLPHGVFDFELTGCTPGSTVTITTTWPDLRGITGYMKYGPVPLTGANIKLWYVPENVTIHGNTVSYTITDGGLGDDDLTANGTIRDPGGPVAPKALSSAQPIPTLPPWASALLGALLLLQLLWYAPRRGQGRAKR